MNNHFPVTSHVTLSWGRDYGDVAPLKGVITAVGDMHWSLRSMSYGLRIVRFPIDGNLLTNPASLFLCLDVTTE